ncbi:DUF1398 domain-containing protein [Emticicia sp. C21]|uniref:DUF1398 domain-containing protein n=1 Tax=Emticicia sp. C21 TaxID=2302915 RepID=UPI000E34E253|nr:DUF1398 family protein [Emticicia sp. C21]RFS14514.1 DUF1398 domain-containing protein [Emticicia sp. C21]
MFTLNQIKEAHAKVKSGADFPNYIQELSQLGILKYTTYVNDGHSQFIGKDKYTLTSESKYPVKTIAEESKMSEFQNYLKQHQQGQSDYPTFCTQAAETGVEKWVSDLINMTCTYYNKKANAMLVETIQGV